ncbi:ankyrin repeat domain-containing protein [Wolbachia endosymbiont of Folsomia candida]|uniref:ankyrin repeat domain-containing protein n=1 Tax=Wolbachia endosymbiont of Folsomia candida TaxID=169402 RepID=UPI000A64DE88|nr:hypothetical protein [Wolbachia endosymbiont of Folsomia candida]APR98815.1 hypothetical protein ASM33_06330 [Wolbachia endosymbiont of Folsomia candida]
MAENNGSKNKFDISSINPSSNVNFSNDEFSKEFSFLFRSISKEDESRIISAVKVGDYEEYRNLHDGTFIASPKKSLSPLHHAVTCNNKDIDAIKKTIKSVLQSGIDINHPDEQGNTPLMYLLSEAAKQGKKYSTSNLTGVIKLLIERGASLNEHNESEWASGSDFIDELKSKKVLTQKEIDDIYKAQQDLKEKVKKELSANIQDIKDVSIYGNCAKIQLKGNKEEFKISEFLQSDFCKSNGISGFSTLHDNGKSGMHGVVSSEGVRHYVVTDGSYEMMLNWPANGVNHTIKIHINAEGSVTVDKEYLDQYKAGEIDVAANKDVKLGNLFLAEALAKGRWKEKQVQNEVQNETIRSAIRDPVQKNAATHAHEIVEPHNVMTSTPLSGAQQPNFGNVSPISYQGNYHNGIHENQRDNSIFPPIPSNSGLESQQQPVVQRPKTPPPTPLRVSSLIKGQRQLENLQQPVIQHQSVGNQTSEDEGNDHLINNPRSGRENVGKSNPYQLEILLEEIRNRSKQDNRGLKKVHTSNEPPQNEDVPELQLRFNQDNKGLRKVNSTNELPQNEGVPELQKKFDQEKYGLKTITTINEPPQNKDVPELLAKLKSVNTDGMSEQTKKHLIEAGLLEEISTDVKTEEVSTDSEQPSSPNSGSDSGFSSPTHTSHSESQVDTEELEERLTNIVEQNLIDFDQELETAEEWDSTYDFPLHDDSGFEEELEALETLSKEFEDEEKNEQIHSETATAELKNAPADQVMSELKEALNPDSREIPQGSKLGELLKKNAAQLEIGVIEGEDTSEKSAIADGSAIGDGFDRNRVKRGNQGIQLSKKIRQPWVERVTTTPTNDKDKGIS